MSRSLVIAIAIATPALAQAQPAPTPAPSPAPAAPAPTTPDPAAPDPGPAAPAPDPTAPADDLADIEAALGADSTATAKPAPAPASASSMNPDLSFIADFAFAAFSSDANLQGGDHDPHENGFNLQGLELAASKAVDPYFKFNANLNFGEDGVEIEEAYATTLDLPHDLQVRAGQFLTQFGRINPTHPHAWDFADQPFVISRVFGGEANRGLGAEVSYLTPLPWYVEVLASVIDPRGEGTNRSFLGASEAPLAHPWTVEAMLAAKQFFELSDNWSLMWGLSYVTGPNATGERTRTNLVGSDLYLKYRPITFGSDTIVSLQAEVIYRRRQTPGGVLADPTGYAQLFWRFGRRWGTAARYEYGGASRGPTGVVDDLDPDWTGGRHRVAAALTFWPTEFSRLRLQGQVDRPAWLADPIYAAFLALELSVGVHGAHKF